MPIQSLAQPLDNDARLGAARDDLELHPVLEEDEGGHRLDAELLRQARDVADVDGDESDGGVGGSEFAEAGQDELALAAPQGVEVR